MRAAFKNLLEALKGGRDGVLPSMQTFSPLDLKQITRDLELSEAAERRAQSQGLGDDPAELTISKEIENRARKAAEEYRSQLELYESRIRDSAAAGDMRVEIDAAGEAALSELKTLAVNDRNHLVVLRNGIRETEAEYREFRTQNRLTRPARIVAPPLRLFLSLMLVLSFVIETIVNGLFFAEGSTAGIIGGVAKAAALSFLNILPAIGFANYGIPLLTHRRRCLNALGVVTLIAYIVWMLGINLVIAHFRDIYVDAAGKVTTAALIGHLQSNLFSFANTDSWILALFGIALSVIAMIGATKLKDPYWGYGELGFRREQALQRYANDKEKCLEDLTALKNDAVQDMTDVVQGLRSYAYDKDLARQGRSRFHQDFCAFLEHLATSYKLLSLGYHEMLAEHARARQLTLPQASAPARPPFLEPPGLYSLPELDQDSRGIAIQRLEQYIKAVNDEYSRTVAAYDTLAELDAAGGSERNAA